MPVGLLPFGRLRHRHHLHGRDFVFGAVGGPVRAVGGDHVGTRLGEVEGGVDHSGLHAFGHLGAQHGVAGAALDADPVALVDATLLRVVRMNFEPVFVVPHHIFGTPGLRTHVVLRQDAPGGQDQRELARDLFFGRHILRDDETSLAAHELVNVHGLGADLGCVFVARPLHAAVFVDHRVGDAPEGRCERGNLGHDVARVRIVHGVTERVREFDRDLPVRQAGLGRHDLAHPRDTALGVGEGAVLLQER